MSTSALDPAIVFVIGRRVSPSAFDRSSGHARPRRLRFQAGAGVVFGALGLCWGVAVAHVTVSPREAPSGAYVRLTFNVPNERATTDTSSVTIAFPHDRPIASIKVETLSGWKFRLTTRHLRTPLASRDGRVSDIVETVTWFGGAIKPNEFAAFSVRAGPLPATPGPLAFKALQTYSNGEIVRWIELRKPGEPEPANPAPILRITDSGATAATP